MSSFFIEFENVGTHGRLMTTMTDDIDFPCYLVINVFHPNFKEIDSHTYRFPYRIKRLAAQEVNFLGNDVDYDVVIPTSSSSSTTFIFRIRKAGKSGNGVARFKKEATTPGGFPDQNLTDCPICCRLLVGSNNALVPSYTIGVDIKPNHLSLINIAVIDANTVRTSVSCVPASTDTLKFYGIN